MLLAMYKEVVSLWLQMSPYLLLGFGVAGVLHAFVPLSWIARHLGQSNISSVTKAVVLGIPLPLCSCGVVPAAVLLRTNGASIGAVIAFLIATPITGVDSILATYSLLGLPFTIVRILSAAATAFVAGVAANFLASPVAPSSAPPAPAAGCCTTSKPPPKKKASGYDRMHEAWNYGFVKLIDDTWKPLSVGVLVGALIALLIPSEFIQNYIGSGWQALLIMMLLGIPMYVCATGSIPIAAALMLKGLSPGAALVFLLTGPATNAVTLITLTSIIGRRATAVYLVTLALLSLLSGYLLNQFLGATFLAQAPVAHHHGGGSANFFEVLAAVGLAVLVGQALLRWLSTKKLPKG